jgi:hypothetical protein
LEPPPDDPLRWLLADPRGLRVTGVTDMLWIRLVDVAATLAARRYAAPGRLVLEVEDAFWPANTGRYLLEGGRDGERARGGSAHDRRRPGRAGGRPRRHVPGGVRFAALARAGRVVEHSAGAAIADTPMLSSDPLPHCTTDF